jgi:hypothetical protein
MIIALMIAGISIVWALYERSANIILCRWMKDKGIVPDSDEIKKYTEKMIKEYLTKK